MPIMIDMEKPKRCEDCPIDYDQVCCNLGAKRYFDDEWKDEEERLYGRTYSDECPLKEIVLCKDCKYCVDEPWMGRSVYICNRTPWQRSEGERKAEDFCSRGERREA